MSKRFLICLISLFLFFLMHLPVMASLIVFTHTGVGSGTLNGNAFSDKEFTITAYSDTDNRNTSIFADYFIFHNTANITINGLGSVDFTIPTQTWIDDQYVGFGLYDTLSKNLKRNLFTGPRSSLIASWDMQSSIGPITELGYILQWDLNWDDVTTSGGILRFDSQALWSSPATFSAVVNPVPIPSTMLLLGSGFLGLIGLRRKHRK